MAAVMPTGQGSSRNLPGTPDHGGTRGAAVQGKGSTRGAAYAANKGAAGKSGKGVADSIVRNAVGRSLDLRPDLVLSKAPRDMSATAKQYRERAGRALQQRMETADVDLAGNWARKLTESTADDRLCRLEEYMHAKSKRLPYTWTWLQVLLMVVFNNGLMFWTFAFLISPMYNFTPFDGALSTTLMEANRINLIDDSDQEQRRFIAEAESATASLRLTVAETDAGDAPHISLTSDRVTASSTLSVSSSTTVENSILLHSEGTVASLSAPSRGG